MGDWRESRGSRPAGLNGSDIFEFRRNGERLGRYRADQFNWDLWCEYRLFAAAQRDMEAAR